MSAAIKVKDLPGRQVTGYPRRYRRYSKPRSEASEFPVHKGCDTSPHEASYMSRAVLFFLAVSICAFAQSDRGALSGQLTDPSGAGIPGADVQALNLATGVKSATKSLENGSYLLGALPFGSYDVTV